VSEREREKIYWVISLGLVALSPLLIHSLARLPDLAQGHYSISDHFLEIPRFFCLLFASLLGANLFELLLALLTRRPILIWKKNLTTAIEHQCQEPLDSVRARIINNLQRLGFTSEPLTEENKIVFRKERKQQPSHFFDMTLSGNLLLHSADSGTQTHAEVTFCETVVIETSERANLRGLANEIVGIPSNHDFATVPFGVYSAFSMALLTLVCSLLALRVPWVRPWLLVCAFTQVIATATAQSSHKKNPKNHFGMRVAWTSAYLGLIPCWAWIVQSIRNLMD